MAMHRILTLVRKELQALLRDPQGRALLIAPVVLQLAIFSFAATLEVKNNTLAVFNQDAGADSIELIQRFAKARAFTRILYAQSEEELRQMIDHQRALVALRFASDFSRNVRSRRSGVHAGDPGWAPVKQRANRFGLRPPNGPGLAG